MQNNALDILADADGYISCKEIADRLEMNYQTAKNQIGYLARCGYEIEHDIKSGHRLISCPDCVDVRALKLLLHNKIIGKTIVVLDCVDSTNDYIKRIGNSRAENGTVVVAREQLCGRGRLGRSWLSQKDEGLMFSILLKPDMPPSQVSQITPLAGLAVCKALREATGLDCRIKWPNDIVLGNKKLVGILTEMSTEFEAVEYIVTGVGINVEQTQFPSEIAGKASSLLLEAGRRFDKNRLLVKVLEQIEKELCENDLRLTSKALEQYSKLCVTIGRRVTFTRGTALLSGTAIGVDDDGQLRVKTEDNSICVVNSGEVTVQGIY